ncbi:MAG TPA: hypothetical protein VFI39_10530 [Gemmatimonadales bacterium]|nr:hypothetical protein [Gemmatimonadales bacterium]
MDDPYRTALISRAGIASAMLVLGVIGLTFRDLPLIQALRP